MHNKWKTGFSILASWAVMCALSACDTVAELTFEEEQIIEAAVQGLVSPACGISSNTNTSDAILRFSVLTSFDARLTPGRRYSALGEMLEPGKNFNADDIVFSDGWFFIVNEDGTDLTCQSTADCPENAACMSATEMGIQQYYYAPSRFCVYATTVTPASDPGFTHFKSQSDNALIHSLNTDGRTFAFILDNSATLDGSADTGIPDNAAATDPYQYRKVGLNQFIDGLSVTDEDQPRYEFSAHFANGSGSTGVYDASPAWMRSEAVWESTVMNKYPSPSGGSPIWETAAAALQKMQDSANTAYSRTVVTITDGLPNPDTTDDAFNAFSRLVQANANVPMHWLELVTGDNTVDMRYAQAVATGCGTHYIFNNPAQFPKIMRNLAINSESYWDIPLKFSVKLPKDRTYRLATTMVATVGNAAVTFEAQRMNEQNETMDYRMVFLGK